ncbi:matrixin family metalloprotease [Candidatus Kaiserbacteria bacterium]|nr:matrixin family metalloprotease [Candidatus Kaiserbacteria bacterium]
MKIIKTLAVVIGAGLAIYVWRAPLYTVYTQTYAVLFPCREPITYRLGIIDPQFGLSTTTALADMEKAARLWDQGPYSAEATKGTADKKLLVYDQARGAVVISFTYDTRQETTQKLSAIGASVNQDRAAYDALKAEYASLYADYTTKKAAFAAANDTLKKEAAQYQAEVASWNARGGAPKSVYEQLQAQKAQLTQMQVDLQRQQKEINAQVDTVNQLVAELNGLAKSLNLDVSAYNTIGALAGEEFEQGLYESSLGKRTITIFEYENHTKLVRVLAHEMGHALGLDHVEDEGAIMAAINEGTGIALTVGDIEELDRICAQDPISILRTKLSDFGDMVSTGEWMK